MVDITKEIGKAVSEEGVEGGICHLFVPHTTAGITINEGADPSVQRDILEQLDRTIPWESGYHHTEGNAAAHIKAVLVGSHAMVFIRGKELCLGTWQSVFLCEFDGPRQREVWIEFSRP
jgi:secondary thiamine-phosphate synthase enzyme